MAETVEHVNKTAELCEMLWGFLQDLDRVRHQKRKPSVDKVLRVAHAVSQLSGAYLKAVESHAVPDLAARISALEARLQESVNGHHAPRP